MNHKTFFTADSHFGHKKIIEFEKKKRPFATIEEHDEELIDRWNSTVNKKDTVWHLGDFCFSEKSLEIAQRLNGVKKLVLGNHDMLATYKYLNYFNKVYGAVKYKDFILSHIPVHDSQKLRYKGNIHGHLHSKSLHDPFYYCVSVEHDNLYPVNFDTIINRYGKND